MKSSIRRCLAFGAVLAAVLGAPGAARSDTPPSSPAEAQGRADRATFQAWIDGLTPDERRGADFWAAQRSLPKPPPCGAGEGGSNPAFAAGCQEAQKRLALSDARRKTDPAYRVGWNARVEQVRESVPPLAPPAVVASRPFEEMGEPAVPSGRSNAPDIASGMVALVKDLDKAIVNGGYAGIAGQVFLVRALSAHGVKDPYEEEMILADGMRGRMPDGTSTFDAIIEEANREYNGVPQVRKYLGVAHLLGINPRVAQSFFDYKKDD
jgi:hypothetical protein